MKRRDFLKTSVVAGAALSLNFEGLQAALSSNTVAVEQAPDLVAVMGGEPRQSLRSTWRHRQIYQERTKSRYQTQYRMGSYAGTGR